MTDTLTSKERVSELISYWESCDPGDETFIREDILRDTIALLKSEGDCTSALGDAYRVFCPKHDTHKARYTDGRPELDDRCPTCVIESLEDRAHGAEVGAAILRDRLERATQPPTAVDVAPIAKLTVRDGLVQRAGLYAPGLPDGDHDVFPVPLSPKGELRPHVLAEPPSALRAGDRVEWRGHLGTVTATGVVRVTLDSGHHHTLPVDQLSVTKDAGECGACDKPGEHCANVHGICSRHGGRAHETSVLPHLDTCGMKNGGAKCTCGLL